MHECKCEELRKKDEEIAYWKHKLSSCLFILSNYVSSERFKELLEEIENDGYNIGDE